MVTIDIRHKVTDYETWKAAFDAARDVRREAGEIACRVYTAHGNGNDVVVSLDWDSLARAQQFLASPSLFEGMTRAGVREMPKIVILDQRDQYMP